MVQKPISENKKNEMKIDLRVANDRESQVLSLAQTSKSMIFLLSA